jgi:hypothetical protein
LITDRKAWFLQVHHPGAAGGEFLGSRPQHPARQHAHQRVRVLGGVGDPGEGVRAGQGRDLVGIPGTAAPV